MDYIMAYRLIECMREGLAPDYDVYDAAAWSAPLPLTEMSVAKGSAPMKFPDFTRGEWKNATRVTVFHLQSPAIARPVPFRDARLGDHRHEHRRVSFLPALFFWRRAQLQHDASSSRRDARRRGGSSASRWSPPPSAPTRRTSSPTWCASAASPRTGCGGLPAHRNDDGVLLRAPLATVAVC